MKLPSLKILILTLLIGACKNKTENKTVDAGNATVSNQSKDTKGVHKNIRIMAKPDSIPIDALSTAVIVVDMENDFGAKGGMFDRAGVNISMIRKVIDPTAKVLAAARQAGIKIIYLKMGYHS